jgi:hypothetical protein
LVVWLCCFVRLILHISVWVFGFVGAYVWSPPPPPSPYLRVLVNLVVLLVGVDIGIEVGIGTTLLQVIHRSAQPRCVVLGKVEGRYDQVRLRSAPPPPRCLWALLCSAHRCCPPFCVVWVRVG